MSEILDDARSDFDGFLEERDDEGEHGGFMVMLWFGEQLSQCVYVWSRCSLAVSRRVVSGDFRGPVRSGRPLTMACCSARLACARLVALVTDVAA